jgi:predicted transcriptional regulator
MRMTAEIVVAFLGQSSITPEQLPGLVSAVRSALSETQPFGAAVRSWEGYHGEASGGAHSEMANGRRADPPEPAVPIEQSVTPNYLISLEDGRRFRSLKRHLMKRYGLTPEAYRAKWGLPDNYPMVAPTYAAERSRVAIRSGLGRARPLPAEADLRRRQDLSSAARAAPASA